MWTWVRPKFEPDVLHAGEDVRIARRAQADDVEEIARRWSSMQQFECFEEHEVADVLPSRGRLLSFSERSLALV